MTDSTISWIGAMEACDPSVTAVLVQENQQGRRCTRVEKKDAEESEEKKRSRRSKYITERRAERSYGRTVTIFC